MTAKQRLRRLQLAVNHIDAVIADEAPGLAELSEALDLIHSVEGEIAGEDE
jgi:hypothetical protein